MLIASLLPPAENTSDRQLQVNVRYGSKTSLFLYLYHWHLRVDCCLFPFFTFLFSRQMVIFPPWGFLSIESQVKTWFDRQITDFNLINLLWILKSGQSIGYIEPRSLMQLIVMQKSQYIYPGWVSPRGFRRPLLKEVMSKDERLPMITVVCLCWFNQ